MKAASSALIALLASNQFIKADLYTITLVTGATAHFTTYDIDLIYGGNTYQSGVIIIERDGVTWETGIVVGSLKVTATANEESIVFGQQFLHIAHNGGLDGGRITLERVFMASPGDTSAGTVLLFDGRISDLECTRTTATINVNSDIELLNIKMPRNLYQPGCLYNLYSVPCGINQSTYTVSNAVTSGSTVLSINNTLSQSAGYFDQGALVFTSGSNIGVSRTVLSYSPGSIEIAPPLLSSPATGDTFNIYPGCDKQQSTCTNKFANLANFKAFPFVPCPETAI